MSRFPPGPTQTNPYLIKKKTKKKPKKRKNTCKPCWASRSYEKTPEGLNQQIQDFLTWISPTKEETAMRKDVVQRIRKVVQQEWPEAQVEVFGSCLTNLCVPTSDVDVVVSHTPETHSLKTLYTLAKRLSSLARPETLQVVDSAKVPIIKITDIKSGADVDISLGIVTGRENSHVVQEYVVQYPCLRPLTLIIKFYLKQKFLNNPWTGGLGSYTLVLIIISYLQLQTSPEENKTLAELLLGFFEFYGRKFNYSKHVISIKNGGQYIDKKSKNWFRVEEPGLLSVEDPYNPSNDVGSSTFRIECIRIIFEEAYDKLSHYDIKKNNSCELPFESQIQCVQISPSNSPNSSTGSSDTQKNETHNFPDLSQIIWVNCHVQSTRRKIKRIYSEIQST